MEFNGIEVLVYKNSVFNRHATRAIDYHSGLTDIMNAWDPIRSAVKKCYLLLD